MEPRTPEELNPFDADLKRLEEIRATVRLAASTTDVVFLLSFIDKLWNEYTRKLQQLDDAKFGPLFQFPTRRETEKAMDAVAALPKHLQDPTESGPVTGDITPMYVSQCIKRARTMNEREFASPIQKVVLHLADRALELQKANTELAIAFGFDIDVIAQRDEAIAMLADWCLRVDKIGTGWDDWDEGYKNAMYRPCGIRDLIDAAKKKLEPEYER